MSAQKLLTLDFSKEEALEKVFAKLPVFTSKKAGWNGIYLAYDYYLPGKTPEVAGQQHGIAIFTEVPMPIRVERKLDPIFRPFHCHTQEFLRLGLAPCFNKANNIDHRQHQEIAVSIFVLQ